MDYTTTLSDLSLTPDNIQRFETLIALLQKWNKAYNLTAITRTDDIISKHIADSLAIQPLLYGDRILDVGTGAGFPGLPLAIVTPGKQFTLLDSNNKKIRFIRQAVMELKLSNVTTIHCRVEQCQPDDVFTTITSRAFASICDMLNGCRHLLAENGKIIAMKGAKPDDELANLPDDFQVERVQSLTIPGLSAQRCAITLVKSCS